ncbi:MAG: ABC transporter permease [Chloroflexi bacterium]|nr:ABC transporter permease [Chloroflexota bacterium]
MAKYVARRLVLTVPSLAIVTVIVFSLVRIVPGSLAVALLGDDYSKEAEAKLNAELGLDGALPVQYVRWLRDLSQGDLGASLLDRRPVGELLAKRAPVTIQLSLMTLAFAMVIGLPIGLVSALKPNSPADFVLRSAAIFGLAAPSFWLATLFLVYAANWFGYSPPIFYAAPWSDLGTNLQMMLWPALISSVVGGAVIMRMTRAMMLEVIREDYIRTAYAKGLTQSYIVIRHALRNALIPVVTVFGLSVANILSGSVISETVFGLPGMGRLLVTSVLARDMPVVQAITIISAAVVMLVNIGIDLTYAYLDPRLRYS